MKKKGYVIWISGYPGSGKSKLSSLIHTQLEKSFGKIIRLSGDDLRQILNLKGYSKKDRKNIGYIYHDVCKRLSDNGVNILIDVVCLFKDIRKQNRKYLKNYIEVYIETDFKKVIRKKSKPFYRKKTKNVWGKDLTAELPTRPDILIKNDFKRSVNLISKHLLREIKKLKS